MVIAELPLIFLHHLQLELLGLLPLTLDHVCWHKHCCAIKYIFMIISKEYDVFDLLILLPFLLYPRCYRFAMHTMHLYKAT